MLTPYKKITPQRCVSNYRRWMTGFHPPCSLPADNQFRMSILERLEQMERRMVEMARDNNQQQQQRQNQQQHGSQLATPPPPPPEDHEQVRLLFSIWTPFEVTSYQTFLKALLTYNKSRLCWISVSVCSLLSKHVNKYSFKKRLKCQ